MHKIDHHLVDVEKEKYLRSGDSRTRGGHEFYQQRTTDEAYRNFFFSRTVIDWNKLPSTSTAAKSLEEFRASLPARPTQHWSPTKTITCK